jgi:hypothetical protein
MVFLAMMIRIGTIHAVALCRFDKYCQTLKLNELLASQFDKAKLNPQSFIVFITGGLDEVYRPNVTIWCSVK